MITKSRNILIVVLICVLMGLPSSLIAAEARRAIAADGDGIESSVNRRTGRAPFILIFDEDGNLIESRENPAIRDRKTGPVLAQWLYKKRIDTLIGGRMGRHLRQGLEQHRINWIETEGTVRETIIEVLKKEEN